MNSKSFNIVAPPGAGSHWCSSVISVGLLGNNYKRSNNPNFHQESQGLVGVEKNPDDMNSISCCHHIVPGKTNFFLNDTCAFNFYVYNIYKTFPIGIAKIEHAGLDPMNSKFFNDIEFISILASRTIENTQQWKTDLTWRNIYENKDKFISELIICLPEFNIDRLVFNQMVEDYILSCKDEWMPTIYNDWQNIWWLGWTSGILYTLGYDRISGNSVEQVQEQLLPHKNTVMDFTNNVTYQTR